MHTLNHETVEKTFRCKAFLGMKSNNDNLIRFFSYLGTSLVMLLGVEICMEYIDTVLKA